MKYLFIYIKQKITLKHMWILIVNLLILSNCYAGGYITTISEISVKCSRTSEEAQPQVYPGIPNTYLKLVTKGIKTKVDGQDTFVEYQNWHGGDVVVVAKCTVLGVAAWSQDMFLYSEAHPIPILQCDRGEGISITMYSPNDLLDPDKYQYVADLVKVIHVRNKQPKKSMQTTPVEPDIEKLSSLQSNSDLL